MMIELNVEVSIRKGLGPDWFNTNYPVGFDDLPDETTEYEIKQMAKQEVIQQLIHTIDYPVYGENWKIIDYHFS